MEKQHQGGDLAGIVVEEGLRIHLLSLFQEATEGEELRCLILCHRSKLVEKGLETKAGPCHPRDLLL